MNTQAEAYRIVGYMLCIIGNYAEYGTRSRNGIFTTLFNVSDYISIDPHTWFEYCKTTSGYPIYFDYISKTDQENIISLLECLVDSENEKEFQEWQMYCLQLASEMDKELLKILFIFSAGESEHDEWTTYRRKKY